MISNSTYIAAGIIAPVIENHFAHQLKSLSLQGQDNLAPAPSASVIESILDTAFWASLRREEGRSPKISIALLPPDRAENPLLFESTLPLTTATLTKLSPGVERPGVHLGVWYEGEDLYIWGTTLKIPNICFVLDVSEPGLLVVKHRRFHGFGKFANVAVLIGDQIKIVDEQNGRIPDCPPLLKSLLGFTWSGSWNDSVNVLVQLAVSMRAHHHGGTLLVVPAENERWRNSIIHPIKYAVTPPYKGLADLMKTGANDGRQNIWQNMLRSEIETIAGFTAVDGATVMTDQYEVKAFGAKIGRQEGNARVDQIFISEPVVGGEPVVVNAAQSGGTRHLSAAQFVQDQRDSLAMVASQDGHFTIFTWSHSEGMVQAHRIDSLLL
jgi:hypothetical protein